MKSNKYIITKETRKKLRESHLGQIPWNKNIKTGIKPTNAFQKGRMVSEEERKRLSISKKGTKYKKMSDIGRKNISLAHMGYIMPESQKEKIRLSSIGKIQTEETKKKISISNKGRIISEETKQKMRKPKSEEAKKNIREARIKQIRKPHKEETKKKISNTEKGKKLSEETKLKLRLATIKYFREVCGGLFPCIGHNEKQILDKLEQELKYKILRQYECEGYFIDGYIPEINLAIEIDEKPKNKEKDIEREKTIKNKLGCEFMRINDFD